MIKSKNGETNAAEIQPNIQYPYWGGVNKPIDIQDSFAEYTNRTSSFKSTLVFLALSSVFATSSPFASAQEYEYVSPSGAIGKLSVEGKKIIFNDQLSRYRLNAGYVTAYKNEEKTSLFFKDFEEIVINIKSTSKEDTKYEDRGALAQWGGLTNSFGNASVLTINLSEGKAKDNALALQGWRQRINAKQINITTDATEAAALHAGSGDFLILNVDKLNVSTKGNDNVIGLKVSPGKRSANSAPNDRPLADRYITFGETEVTMEHGGVGVYIGFDEKDEEVVSSGLVTEDPKKFDNRYYIVSADLGNTVIALKGNSESHILGNVGLFAAGLGVIKANDFTFLSPAENMTATALRAEVNEDYYPEIGYIKKDPNFDPLKDSKGNFWEDSHRIVKAAQISINGAVNIKVSENEGSYAAKAGKDGTIEINPEKGNQSIQIIGAILADNTGALENKEISDADYGDTFHVVHNPASVVINANSKDSFLNSKITVENGGQVKLGLGNGARWNVRGNSHVTQLNALEGNAYVDLTHERETRNTLVIDNLQGSEKSQLTFVLHSDIKGKDAVGANDKVIIKSAGSDTQIHTLHIPSTGEPEGDETRGSYLVYVPQNVSLMLNETHHPDKNVSHRVVDKGLYLYTLASDKDVGTPDEIKTNLRAEDKYDGYYLTLAGFTPDNQQGDDNKPVTPLLSPTAKAVLAMAGMGGQNAMYHNQLSDLRKRLGEVRGMTESNGLWVSASGQRDRFDGFASNGVKQNAYRFNLGLDHKIGSWLIGANFKYLHGTQKTSNPDSHAKGKVNSAGANIYGTWIAENGFYTDIVASFDHYHQKITTSMLDGRGVSGKVNNLGLGLSAEVGKKFGLTKDFFVEPQAQLAYYWIKGKDFSMSNGMKVEQDDFNSLVGRLGVVAGKDFRDAEGNTKGQVFVKGGVKQQFAGKQKLRANSVQFKDELKGTSGYYGLGFEANPNKKVSLYGHVERENGKHYTKEIEVMLGLRYKF